MASLAAHRFRYLALLLTCCQPKMPSTFEWLPTVSAPVDRPVTVMQGTLHFPGGGSTPLPAGRVVNNGWGELGPIELVGDTDQPLPDRLTVTWFSWAENRFFSGDFALPTDTLNALFDVGFKGPVTGGKATYDNIVVGMAPGGVVSVWVAGEGIVRSVATMRAAEIPGDWSRVINNPSVKRDDLVREVLLEKLGSERVAALSAQGVDTTLRARASVRREYDVIIIGASEMRQLWLGMIDGEREFVDLAASPDMPDRPRAPIHHLELAFSTRDGSSYFARLDIDEAEALEAMEELAGTVKGRMSFVVNVGLAPAPAKVTLRDSSRLAELGSARTDIRRQ